ncbi:Crp/Fnr family transcriptional regulator [Falsochrobactrum shanghaiense]|uniref:Crp/Fnr family transcriptional regulator n=1 Tax=Falsochrobactrum shanghaiense TaxID=2201899 RepID=A0A316J9R9_9HYPH|nr:Crp/Fnr family transcriptional regulator [Falsochrobactrum shanghaiense]PWL17509.1 Crp/Fnr family transcriptional regulator [Falsochrobactrum shanghaiense]
MEPIIHTLVRKLPVFSGMEAAAFSQLMSQATHRIVPKNSAVFQQGEEARLFYLLIQGRLKVTQVTADGQQIIVRVVNPGDLFGFAMALGRTDYPGTPSALVDSSVLAWPMEMMSGFMARNPVLAVNTMQMIGSRLDAAHSRIREISTEEVEQRVAHAIIRLLGEAGVKEKGGIRIDFPVSRQDIAELTGTTLHTVSRIISQWQSKGWVEGGRKSLFVRDLCRLRQIADPEI